MAAHADDLVAVLDHLGITRPVPLVGHSMGGFVAVTAGVRHPDRFSTILLIDGGVALPVPPGADIDAVLEAVTGPAIRRLSMTFPDAGAYLDFLRAHPALHAAWSAAIEAVRADATDTLTERGMLDEPRGLYDAQRRLVAQRIIELLG